jgi:hypothetical protein
MGIAKLSTVVKMGDFCHSSYKMTDQANAKLKKIKTGKLVTVSKAGRPLGRQAVRQAGR